MFVARRKESGLLRWSQLVRRAIAARVLDEREWTVIDYNVALKKVSGAPEPLRKKAPEASSTDLRAHTLESIYRTARMLALRPANCGLNFQPIANNRNFAKRHTCLRHAEGSRVHAEK